MLFRFSILYQEKSGNPVSECLCRWRDCHRSAGEKFSSRKLSSESNVARFFKPKNTNLGKFSAGLAKKMLILLICLFHVQVVYLCYGHLVHFVVILVYFFLFWYVVPRKIWQPCLWLRTSGHTLFLTRKKWLTENAVDLEQGDQIGEFCTNLAAVYIGQLFIYRSIPIFGLLFP
jgi:hypothetical protein